MAEFLAPEVEVKAEGFRSPLLESIGETEILDELRVLIRDARGTTAYFTFSTQLALRLHRLTLYGPDCSLVVDDDQQTVIRRSGRKYKSYLNMFVPPFVLGKQYIGHAFRNCWKFLKMDFHADAGMGALIRSFYDSIADDGPPPIPYEGDPSDRAYHG